MSLNIFVSSLLDLHIHCYSKSIADALLTQAHISNHFFRHQTEGPCSLLQCLVPVICSVNRKTWRVCQCLKQITSSGHVINWVLYDRSVCVFSPFSFQGFTECRSSNHFFPFVFLLLIAFACSREVALIAHHFMSPISHRLMMNANTTISQRWWIV